MDKIEIQNKINKLQAELDSLDSSDKVIVNNWDLTEFEKWYDKDYCLQAVKQDGNALQYVKIQTREICLQAVKQDGNALQYVKTQTREICLQAVKEDGNALQYIDKRIFNKEDIK